MLKTGPAAGIFWMCMATLISSISGGMVRELAGQIPTMELVFFRNLIALIVLIPIVRRQGVGLPSKSQLPVYALRVLFAYSAMVLLFYALARMPIADVYALQYTIPLFTILLAVIVLKQHADIHSWAACLVGFLGTLIVMRPGIIEITLASLAALTTAFMHAGSNTTIKILARRDNPEAITLWTNFGMLPLALIPTLFLCYADRRTMATCHRHRRDQQHRGILLYPFGLGGGCEDRPAVSVLTDDFRGGDRVDNVLGTARPMDLDRSGGDLCGVVLYRLSRRPRPTGGTDREKSA